MLLRLKRGGPIEDGVFATNNNDTINNQGGKGTNVAAKENGTTKYKYRCIGCSTTFFFFDVNRNYLLILPF